MSNKSMAAAASYICLYVCMNKNASNQPSFEVSSRRDMFQSWEYHCWPYLKNIKCDN